MRFFFFLVTARTSQGMCTELPPTPPPAQPSAPPSDEGYGESGSGSGSDDLGDPGSRGVVRPLCRAGDPRGENPLGENQRRRMPMRREEITYHSRRGRRGA